MIFFQTLNPQFKQCTLIVEETRLIFSTWTRRYLYDMGMLMREEVVSNCTVVLSNCVWEKNVNVLKPGAVCLYNTVTPPFRVTYCRWKTLSFPATPTPLVHCFCFAYTNLPMPSNRFLCVLRLPSLITEVSDQVVLTFVKGEPCQHSAFLGNEKIFLKYSDQN